MDDKLQYLKLDYESSLQALIQRTRARYPGVWTDFSDGGFGRIWLDLVAHNTATLSYTLNRIASEKYIPTMQLRESAVREGARVGYRLRGGASATCVCRTELPTPAEAAILIAEGTPVTTADGNLTFEVASPYRIEEGEITPVSTVVIFDFDATSGYRFPAFVRVETGSIHAEVLYEDLDMRDTVEPWMIFRQRGVLAAPEYTVTALSASTLTPGYARFTLDRPWQGSAGDIAAEVIDRNIVLTEGRTITETDTAPASPSGLVVKLRRTPVVEGSLKVDIDGTPWPVASSVVLAGKGTPSVEFHTLPDGDSYLLFGTDSFGAYPPAGSTITITYRTGGGTAGNIKVGAIDSSLVGLVENTSSPINVPLRNVRPGSGGSNPETLAEARVNIPAHTRANDRCITLQDYQDVAMTFRDARYGQVREARAKVRREGYERNLVAVSAWVNGADGNLVPISGTLKNALRDHLQSRALGEVVVVEGATESLPIASLIRVSASYDPSSVTSRALAAITAYGRTLRPGEPVVYTDFVSMLSAVEGVDKVLVATPNGDFSPSADDALFVFGGENFQEVSLASTESGSVYSATLPAAPLASWGFRLRLGDEELGVGPDTLAGFARVTGTSLSTLIPSRVNLLTGVLTMASDSTPETLHFTARPVVAYSSERTLNVTVSYVSPSDSAAERRKIRASLRTWINGFAPGSSLYAYSTNELPSLSSAENVILDTGAGITGDVVVAFDGVTSSPRVNLLPYQVARAGVVVLNGRTD